VTIGSHGASKHVQIINYPTVSQAVRFLREECQCISITGLMGSCPNSYSRNGYCVTKQGDLAQINIAALHNPEKYVENCAENLLLGLSFPAPFFHVDLSRTRNICIALSKEKFGLPLSLANVCDSFLHIPHPIGGVISDAVDQIFPPLLNTPACLSIALHEITAKCGYSENVIHGHKFTVVKKHYVIENGNDQTTVATTNKAGSEHNVIRSDNSFGEDINMDQLFESQSDDIQKT
jgi:hypothetical protein